MAEYEIYTDSSCDLPRELIDKYNLHVMQLEVIIDDNPPVLNCDLDIQNFYDQLRAGANAKTSAVTPGMFKEEMKKTLSEGKDILYLGFSSGLSATYNNGIMIIRQLQKDYPDRKMLYTDTLNATLGQGLIVCYAAELKKNGATIEEVLEKVEAMKQYVQLQVTVKDLFFLKRGGRLDTKSAMLGSMLQIKPIIIVNQEGKLENAGKVRGRKASIKTLFQRMKTNADLDTLNKVYISHSDCMEDAQELAEMIKEEWSNADILIGDIGPVIGAHAGPGALVLVYVGKVLKGE